MAEALTFEKVWAALMEERERHDKLTLQMEETDRRMKETDRQMKETDRQMKETDRQMKETDRQLTKLGEMIGGISRNHGNFAEEYFINSLYKNKPVFFGEKFDKMLKFQIAEDKEKIKAEFDILLVNGKSVAIVEVKFKVHEKDIEKLVRKVKHFRQQFPEYQNHQVYLCLASMVFDEAIEQACKETGIAVIKQSGETVIIYDDHLKAF